MNCISQKATGKEMRYLYYACRPKEWLEVDEQCNARRVRADWLDNSVWNSLKAWIREPDVLQAELNTVLSVADAGDSFSNQWNSLDSMIKSYDGQISRLTDAYQAGAMDLGDFTVRKAALTAKISDARRRQDELSSLRKKQISMEKILADIAAFSETVREGLETLDFEGRRAVVELLVERVVVKGEDVTVENVVPLQGRFSVLNTHGGDIFLRTQAGNG